MRFFGLRLIVATFWPRSSSARMQRAGPREQAREVRALGDDARLGAAGPPPSFRNRAATLEAGQCRRRDKLVPDQLAPRDLPHSAQRPRLRRFSPGRFVPAPEPILCYWPSSDRPPVLGQMDPPLDAVRMPAQGPRGGRRAKETGLRRASIHHRATVGAAARPLAKGGALRGRSTRHTHMARGRPDSWTNLASAARDAVRSAASRGALRAAQSPRSRSRGPVDSLGYGV
jgi:hypothetical protein